MGLMNWFKAIAAGKTPDASDDVGGGREFAAPVGVTAAAGASGDTGSEGPVVAGLNFKTAIDAHMKWKVRLEQCLENDNDEKLEVEVISRDDQCVLGKWVHGVGGEHFGHLREFQEMKMEHARFHLFAGDVLTCCLAGDKEGASHKLRSGDYTRTSERVKLHLARLYVQVKPDH